MENKNTPTRRVHKSYEIVTAGFDEMTLKEAQILALAVSKIPQNLPLTREQIKVKIERSEVDALFGVGGYKLVALKKLAKLLQGRTVTVRPRNISPQQELLDINLDDETELRRWKRMVVVPTSEYTDGEFILSFNTDLNEQFLEMRDRMISYSLSHVIGMTSPYHMRLYEILVMGLQEKGTEFRIEVKRLQTMIGAYKASDTEDFGEPKYKRFCDFKARVLDPSLESINSNTNLNVECFTERVGNKVENVVFKVGKKDEIPVESKVLESAILLLEGKGIPRSESTQWFQVAGSTPNDIVNSIQAALDYIENLLSQGKTAHEQGIIKRAITQGWKPAQKRKINALKGLLAETNPTSHDQVKRQDISLELCIEFLKIDKEVSEKFWTCLGRDLISKMAFDRDGYNAPELAKPILDFFVDEINHGNAEFLHFVGAK